MVTPGLSQIVVMKGVEMKSYGRKISDKKRYFLRNLLTANPRDAAAEQPNITLSPCIRNCCFQIPPNEQQWLENYL